MKYDELKYEKLGDMMPFYPRSTLVIRKQFVDEAIADLNEALKIKDELLIENAFEIGRQKAENERLSNAFDKERSETIKYMDELCNAKNEIERLKSENERLKSYIKCLIVRDLIADNPAAESGLELLGEHK